LIGSNKLLDHTEPGKYFDSITTGINISRVSAIHLDIEPHTLADFKENKNTYFKKYLELISKANEFVRDKKIKLSVSIPLNYPEEVLTNLFQKCDHIYLMAYENVKPSFITEKVKEEMALNKDKIVLALRTNDFGNKAEMDELFKLLKVKHTAYHDLDELIKLSKKNLNKKNGK
jgi:hypothetical protein